MFNRSVESSQASAPAARREGDVYTSIQAINESVKISSAWLGLLRQQMAKVIIGQHHLVERLLVGLLTGGHILLEGVPGLAKTLAVKSLAAAVQTDFKRIQFTPDMLADEINRAPAKVQSALLEAMQERQVTLGGKTFELPELFLVLATQNPIEQEGTYPLPEAQVDRFMLKVVITYPTRAEERQILEAKDHTDSSMQVNPVISPADILDARKVVDSIYMDDKIKDYIVSLVYATRDPKAFNLDLQEYIETGASPRATINLKSVSRALAYLAGRGYVTPDDVKSAALDVMRHRLRISYEAEAEAVSSEDIVRKILDTVPVP